MGVALHVHEVGTVPPDVPHLDEVGDEPCLRGDVLQVGRRQDVLGGVEAREVNRGRQGRAQVPPAGDEPLVDGVELVDARGASR